MLNELEKAIKGIRVEDFILVGFFSDDEELPRFHPDLRFVYTELNKGYIKFQSIQQFSKLSIELVDTIELKFESDDYAKGILPMGDFILTTSLLTDNKIEEITFFNLKIEKNKLLCDAFEMHLSTKQILFFDPSFIFGIKIGGIEQKHYWEESIKEQEGGDSEVYPNQTKIRLV